MLQFQNDIFKARDFQPISIRNERLALKKVISICLGLLCSYPTSMKEDIKELETNKKLTYNQRCCYKYRIEEKSVLHYFIETAQSVLPVFEDDISLKKARELAFQNPDYENLKIYFNISAFRLLRAKENIGENKIDR